jgi:hypothetical protein
MVYLLVSAAFAASPAHVDGPPVTADPSGVVLEWAEPFAMATPDHYPWVAGAPAFDQGFIVQLRVDPKWVTPHDVGMHAIYLGATPVAIVNADVVGGCAVGYVMGRPDLAKSELYVGSTELPERIDAVAGQAELAAARAAGAHPIDAPTVAKATQPEVTVADLRGVYAILADRVAACSPGETDLLHVLRAQAGLHPSD